MYQGYVYSRNESPNSQLPRQTTGSLSNSSSSHPMSSYPLIKDSYRYRYHQSVRQAYFHSHPQTNSFPLSAHPSVDPLPQPLEARWVSQQHTAPVFSPRKCIQCSRNLKPCTKEIPVCTQCWDSGKNCNYPLARHKKKLITEKISEHAPIQENSEHEEKVVFLRQIEKRNEQSPEAPDQLPQVTRASINPAQQCVHCSKVWWHCDCVCLLCNETEFSCRCKCLLCEEYVWRCNCSEVSKYIKVKPKDPSPLDIPEFKPMESFRLEYLEVGVYKDVKALEWNTWTEEQFLMHCRRPMGGDGEYNERVYEAMRGDAERHLRRIKVGEKYYFKELMNQDSNFIFADLNFKRYTTAVSWAVFRNTYATDYGTYFNWGWRSALKWTSVHLGIYKRGQPPQPRREAKATSVSDFQLWDSILMVLVDMERKQEHREGSRVGRKQRGFDLELEFLRYSGIWRSISALKKRYELVRNRGEFLG